MLAQTLISIGGIAVIVALAWFLFARAPREPLSEAEAMAAAEHDLPRFRAVRAVCGKAARGALVKGADGRIALLKPHGDHFSARLIGSGAQARQDDEFLIVRLPEAMFAEARLDLGEAAGEWLQMIEEAQA